MFLVVTLGTIVDSSSGGMDPPTSAELVEIGEAVGPAEAAAPFHRLVAVGERDAIDAQERGAGGHLQVRRRERIRAHGAQALLGADHAHAEDRLVEAVYRAAEFLELRERHAGE